MPLIVRSLILVVVAGALLAPAAHASSAQSSIMMDDDQLLYRGPQTTLSSLKRMKALGVDTIRVTVLWNIVAGQTRYTRAQLKRIKNKPARAAAKRQSRRFRAANPATYPLGNWDRYDDLVRLARAVGLRVYFNITGPGPSWAHRKAPKSLRSVRKTYRPNARHYRAFVTAVGRRFSGAYADENQDKRVLPRVSMWSLWNEPNQAGWLSPQWGRVSGKRVMVSPILYRKLHQFGYRGLSASGHNLASDIVLLAETAPQGSKQRTPKSATFPKPFLRELACVKSNGGKYRGRAAKARGCNKFGPKLQSNGYAHHPYTKNVPTTTKHKNKNAITMANIAHLGHLLDQLSTKTAGRIPASLPLYMTEFGFETNPPDPFHGVTLDQQVQYNLLGELLAYRNPRIVAQAQFLLRDVLPIAERTPGTKKYWFTYQSGLYYNNGVPKPAAQAYRFPFIAFPGATAVAPVGFWGQLRFAAGSNVTRLFIQYRRRGSFDPWTRLGPQVPVNPRGFFEASRVPPPGGPVEWRAGWYYGDTPDTLIAASRASTGP